jgi:hypothetical protein
MDLLERKTEKIKKRSLTNKAGGHSIANPHAGYTRVCWSHVPLSVHVTAASRILAHFESIVGVNLTVPYGSLR